MHYGLLAAFSRSHPPCVTSGTVRRHGRNFPPGAAVQPARHTQNQEPS